MSMVSVSSELPNVPSGFLPDILVEVFKPGTDASVEVIGEVLPDGSCRVVLGSSGDGETITALPTEIESVQPRKIDKVKIMGGSLRGSTGKLIAENGTDAVVSADGSANVRIIEMAFLAKLAQP